MSKSFLATKGSNDTHSYGSGSYAQQKKKRVSELKPRAKGLVQKVSSNAANARSGQATPKKKDLSHSFMSEVLQPSQAVNLNNSRLQERILSQTVLHAQQRNGAKKQPVVQYQTQLH